MPAGPVVYGYLGRLGPEKGIGVLLDALEGMPDDLSFRFEFCSATFGRKDNPPEEQALVDRIRGLASVDPRVVVRGQVTDDELALVLARWDALVVPSLWLESGPQVVYEAFSVQTPVIGSDRGGIPELVEQGRTGYLVPPNDVVALRDRLQACAADPDLLRRLRANIGRVRTTTEVAEDMLEVYGRVLRQDPAAAHPPSRAGTVQAACN
jgi:glycosyltransferase involved in cell wall biosynthesis